MRRLSTRRITLTSIGVFSLLALPIEIRAARGQVAVLQLAKVTPKPRIQPFDVGDSLNIELSVDADDANGPLYVRAFRTQPDQPPLGYADADGCVTYDSVVYRPNMMLWGVISLGTATGEWAKGIGADGAQEAVYFLTFERGTLTAGRQNLRLRQQDEHAYFSRGLHITVLPRQHAAGLNHLLWAKLEAFLGVEIRPMIEVGEAPIAAGDLNRSGTPCLRVAERPDNGVMVAYVTPCDDPSS